jgi:hypothetical protein
LVSDEHPRTFGVRYPMKVMTVPKVVGGGVEEQLSLTRWIHFAEDAHAEIPKTQVLAVVNASIGMRKFYEYCLQKVDGEDLYDPTDEELYEIQEEYDDEELSDLPSPSKVYH